MRKIVKLFGSILGNFLFWFFLGKDFFYTQRNFTSNQSFIAIAFERHEIYLLVIHNVLKCSILSKKSTFKMLFNFSSIFFDLKIEYNIEFSRWKFNLAENSLELNFWTFLADLE